MRGFRLLTSLLDTFPTLRLRAANDDEMMSILDVVTHMPEETLRSICSGDMADIAEASAAAGVPICMIGAAVRDVEIDGDTFSVRCQVRFGRQPIIHDVMISGTVNARAMVRACEAVLLESRAFTLTA